MHIRIYIYIYIAGRPDATALRLTVTALTCLRSAPPLPPGRCPSASPSRWWPTPANERRGVNTQHIPLLYVLLSHALLFIV